MANSSDRETTRDEVEEAINVLAARDLVYWDIGAMVWECKIPPQSTIRTPFGEVRLVLARGTDGVLVCSHISGRHSAYLTSSNVGIDSSGTFVELSLLPQPHKQSTDDWDTEDGRGVDGDQYSTRGKPRSVDLRGCFLDHNDMARVSRGLAGNCFLKALSLNGNQLQDASISLLADALLHNGVLEELYLSYNEISVLGSTLLATALCDHVKLSVFDLSHNRVGREGILPWLGRTLRSNRVLKQLQLTHNDIGDRRGSELVASLASTPVTAEEQLKSAISRRRTVATAAPTAAVAATNVMRGIATHHVGESFNTTLTKLLLGNTGISDESASHLQHVLAENCTLTHLDLSCNAFTDQGHQRITVGLAGNHTLRVLNYNENRVECEPTGVALLNALRGHAALEAVFFQDCFRGSGAAVAVAEMLRATTTLTTIDLSHTRLEPPGVVEFYRAIGDNRSLLNLEMSCMGLKSDQAVAILSASLATHAALRFLNLSYNEITLRGCKLLRDAVAGHGARLLLVLEGNSGEKNHPGVQITVGGLKPVRPPILHMS